MIRIIAISLLLVLAGCKADPAKEFTTTIKPTKQQLKEAVTKTVCESFDPIYFSGSKDSKETVKAVREHNAAYKSFGC